MSEIKTSKFIQKANMVHNCLYNYDKSIYIGGHKKIIITCKDHGDFKQTPSAHLAGQGCPECGKNKANNSKRFTTEEFIERAKKAHGNKYNYDKTIYVAAHSSLIITCLIHGDFEQSANNHVRGQGCPKCGAEATGQKLKSNTDDFIEKANKIHGGKYNYDKVDYAGNHTNIIITCLKHGDFEQIPASHLNGCGCPCCRSEKLSEIFSSNTDEFIKKAIMVHGDKYNYDKVDYAGNHTNVIITCLKHGDFEQQPNNHLAGKGCIKCRNEKISELKTLTTKEFIEKAIAVHGCLYNYDQVNYISNKDKVLIKCSIHGIFKQSPGSHLQGSCCPKCTCNISRIGCRWLDSIGIPNDEEHREVGKLIPGRHFKADGFIPETNTVYEFYGDRPHGNLSIYNADDMGPYGKTYGELYRKTMNREKIFKDAGFNLVTMWESEFKKQLVHDFVERSINNATHKV